ncbi:MULTISPECIES: histidinol-phosphatase [unclassified Mameliella]|uniref:histidinol-phosphatase n=1 Tax=unclassified Mameliella TaxID=2630630 RepID=UPI00273E00A3|nr:MULTISPECIES: histidinol-phosphatase [unclassified Mameliella]
MLDLADALSFAQTTADAAGKLALSHFRNELSVEHKADDSPVTIADRMIETYLRERITERFPDHGIYGEEHGTEGLDRRFVWVVDPIDGTKSFVTGHPLFGGLIALLDEGKPRLGQIDMPATGERWCGIDGYDSTLNGVAIRTSGCTDLARAYAYTTDPMLFAGPRAPIFSMLRDRVRLLRFGGDCYNYALLASGYCDLVLECGLEPYDYLPVVQIVQGAGGCITDWQGQALHAGSTGDVVASATPELHAQILAELARLRLAEPA